MSAPPSEGAPRGPRRVWVVAALVVGIALLALPVVFADGRQLLRTAAGIRPLPVALALALTVLSYAAMARSYQGIADAAGCSLSFPDWLRITLVSNTANYLVTSAGLSGFAVRMYLLSQRGVQPGLAVLISLVQTALTNFTLLLFILMGFATLVLHYQLPGVALVAASAAVLAFAATLVYTTVLVFHRRLRRRTLLFVANAIHRVLRRIAPRWTPRRVHLWRFQHNLNEGLEFLFERKDRMVAPAWWILLDWVLTMTILWTAFRSVGYPVAPGVVAVGFAVGLCLSLVSLVPGGLGIMESSMTAVFVGLGVPLEPAVVAVLIFRVAYYVLPLLLSLFFFHGLMRQAANAAHVTSVPIRPQTPQI